MHIQIVYSIIRYFYVSYYFVETRMCYPSLMIPPTVYEVITVYQYIVSMLQIRYSSTYTGHLPVTLIHNTIQETFNNMPIST